MPIQYPRVQIHEIDHSRIEQDHSVNRDNYQIPWYEYIQQFDSARSLSEEIDNYIQRNTENSINNSIHTGIDYGFALDKYNNLMHPPHNTQVDDYMKDIMTDLISHKINKNYSMNYKKIIQEFCKRNNLFLCDKNTLISDLHLKDRFSTFKLINHEYCCFIPYTCNGYAIAYKKDNHFKLNNIPMTYSDGNEDDTYFCMYTFLIQIEKLYRVKYLDNIGSCNLSDYVLLCDCRKELKKII